MRVVKGYVVGMPLQAESRHQKRMYEIEVTQRIISVIRNKKVVLEVDTNVIVRLVGNIKPIREDDDFNRVADCFTDSILNHHPLEVSTDRWKYHLWKITEDSQNWGF